MTPASSARKADQEATMNTPDADAGGRWHSDNDGVWISIYGPDEKVCGVVENAVEYLNEYDAQVQALEARLAAAETARSDAERMSRALNTENNNLMKRAEEAEQERDEWRQRFEDDAHDFHELSEEMHGLKARAAAAEAVLRRIANNEQRGRGPGMRPVDMPLSRPQLAREAQAFFDAYSDAFAPTHESEAT